jgi:hypothetical protein
MGRISEATVEQTWQSVVNLTPAKVQKETDALAKEQPALVAFMLSGVQDIGGETGEVAYYMFFCVYKMFRTAYGKKIPRISEKKILNRHRDILKHMEGLGRAHKKFFDRAARVQLDSQPHVWKYILDVLFDADHDNDVEISQEDGAMIYVLIRTVVELLDETCGPQAGPES